MIQTKHSYVGACRLWDPLNCSPSQSHPQYFFLHRLSLSHPRFIFLFTSLPLRSAFLFFHSHRRPTTLPLFRRRCSSPHPPPPARTSSATFEKASKKGSRLGVAIFNCLLFKGVCFGLSDLLGAEHDGGGSSSPSMVSRV